MVTFYTSASLLLDKINIPPIIDKIKWLNSSMATPNQGTKISALPTISALHEEITISCIQMGNVLISAFNAFYSEFKIFL